MWSYTNLTFAIILTSESIRDSDGRHAPVDMEDGGLNWRAL